MDKRKLTKITLQKWQVKKLIFWACLFILVASGILTYASWDLYTDKAEEDASWDDYLNSHQGNQENQDYLDAISADSQQVETGVYVESLKTLDKKDGNFRVVAEIWFKWDDSSDGQDLDMMQNFRIYNGYINKLENIADVTDGTTRYQRCRVDATVSFKFSSKRFPLESHQLRFYIMPDYSLRQVRLVADTENSAVNQNLTVPGYTLRRSGFVNDIVKLNTTYDHPGYDVDMYESEVVTLLDINRSGMGLYLECFIALFGTSAWVLITLYICTYHRVDPLGMIPAALFGTVGNIMVGANQVSEDLQTGLLIYMNGWGILTIICCAVAVININQIRSHHQDNWFAKIYGQLMFFMILYFTVLGHIVLPLAAYL